MSSYIPMATKAAGSAIGGIEEARAMRANASTYATEGAIAANQGLEQENQQRRAGAMFVGRESAAAAQAGAGTGGSAGRAVAQSALNSTLDALNIRYKSQLQRWAFDTQAGNLRSEANTVQVGGFMKAGAALLNGYSTNYAGGLG